MEIRVLGPLEVWHDGRRLTLGRRKQRVTLALLALCAGRPVSLEQLVDELWGDEPVASAVPNARGYVSELRHLLNKAHPGAARIERAGSGYVLQAETDEIDLLGYECDAAAGRRAYRDGDLETAVACLTRARLRWRGKICEGLPRGTVAAARAATVERDLAELVEELAQAQLELGQPAAAAAVLEQQLATEPLREPSYALLMRARYQLDGTAAALQVYEAARKVLTEQLGVDPASQLQQLHRRILTADPSLEAAEQHRRPAPPRPVPRQLPPAPVQFVGRADEARRLCAALTPQPHGPRPVVAVVHGPGGVGKSALALQVAHHLCQRYPDGQLYVDLQGYTPGLRPLEPVEVLRQLLAAVGVPRDELPNDTADAAALFRSVTAEKRLLLVADNALDTAQVKQLIPGSASCGVVVTSRRRLGSLDAEARLPLTGLPETEAQAMLTGHAGRDIDPEATTQILRVCGGLPLALRIAAARLAARPDMPPAEYANRLATERLDALEHEDMAVRACIRSGYDVLTEDGTDSLAKQAFRALGLLQVPHVAPGVVAAMLDVPQIEPVRSALDQLVEAQLLEPLPNGRYRLHDLIRLVAAEVSQHHDSDSDRIGILQRGTLYYAFGVSDAELVLRPDFSWVFGPPSTADPWWRASITDVERARGWLGHELPCLIALVEQICSRGRAVRDTLLWLSERLWSILHAQCEWLSGYRVSKLVLETGLARHDSELAAWGWLALGRSAADLGDPQAGERHIGNALGAMAECGNHRGLALTYLGLGVVALHDGRHRHALVKYDAALRVAQRHGLSQIESACYHNMSISLMLTGRLSEAARAARTAGTTRRPGALANLAAALCMQGRLEEAADTIEQAIERALTTSDHHTAREALVLKSEIDLRRGNREAAADSVRHALRTIRSAGDRYQEPVAVRQQAKLLAIAGQWERAWQTRKQAEALYATARFRWDAVTEALVGQTEPDWVALEALPAAQRQPYSA